MPQEDRKTGGPRRAARGEARHVANLHLSEAVWQAATRSAGAAGVSVTLEIETRLRAAYGLTRQAENTPAPTSASPE